MTVSNIISAFESATPDDVERGLNWYRSAREQCQQLADEFDISLEVATGVVAVISPRMRWDENVKDARGIIGGSKWSRAFRANAEKAREIIRTGEVNLSGPKVSSFYRNILDPDDPTVVVIDTWAWRIAENRPETKTIDPRLYWRIAAEYREAARILGHTPSQVQAITWERARRISASPMEDGE